MLPVLVFNIIVALSLVAIFAYYYNQSPFTPGSSRKKSKSELTKEDLFGSSTGKSKSKHSQSRVLAKSELLRSSLFDSVRSDEDGENYNTEILTETSLRDLAYVIDELGNQKDGSMELLDILGGDSASTDFNPVPSDGHSSIAGKVMTIINSPFYNIDSTATDIRDAAKRLPTADINTLVRIAGLFERALDMDGPIPADDLFTHSIATARITSWLAHNTGIEIREELAGMAAIVHDTGKLVMKQWRPEAFRQALRKAKEENITLLDAELEILGITHALATRLLLERMHIDRPVTWVATDCHLPVHNSRFPETSLVHMAGNVARVLAIGVDGEEVINDISADIRRTLGIKATNITGLLGESFKDFVASTISSLRASGKPV